MQNRQKVLAPLLIILLVLSLSACGSSKIENKLPGKWDDKFHILTFYSDGTYEETMKYGTGKWTMLENNTLKLTDYYGKTRTFEIESISSDTLTLKSGGTWKKVK